ncbi:MAG: HAD family hydrolase [Candidatus Pacebacteria bacterium]|nr:HAD family hydrolase [Candidatus Paceibacterota bacterium]
MENTRKVTCIALDFDETLAFIDSSREEFFGTWEKRGVPKEIGEKAYKEIHDGEGFSYTGMKKALKNYGYDMDESFEKELWARLEKGLRPFKEAKETIERWMNKCPVVVITAGDDSFQKEKIQRTGFSHLPLIITKFRKKAEAIQTLLKKYGAPIVFIDDKISELTSIKEADFSKKDVILILLDRAGKNKKSEFEAISSLDDSKLTKILGF